MGSFKLKLQITQFDSDWSLNLISVLGVGWRTLTFGFNWASLVPPNPLLPSSSPFIPYQAGIVVKARPNLGLDLNLRSQIPETLRYPPPRYMSRANRTIFEDWIQSQRNLVHKSANRQL